MKVRASWQAIRDEVRRRIHAREWPPGSAIPREVALAEEFRAARATVNRALRELAADGLLNRRRKGGSSVALHPVGRAVLGISVVSREVEESGALYSYHLLSRAIEQPPDVTARRMNRCDACVRVRALHLADSKPYALEDRWIAPDLPGIATAGFDRLSPNEWLLEHIPYTGGDFSFTAEAATSVEAKLLGIPPGTPLLQLDRKTWDGDRVVTVVRLSYRPGSAFRAKL